jgi:hypothetical protein
MSREYVIYTDESSRTGRYHTNFYGGALIRPEDLDYVREVLQGQAQRLGFGAEIKWQKVSEAYLARYKAMMDAFFDLISADLVKVRLMFTDNRFVPVLTPYHRQHQYHLLYYQFFKYAFGLRYSNEDDAPIRLRIYMDELPASGPQNTLFKQHLAALEQSSHFRIGRILVPEDQIAEVNSRDHLPLQCLDVVLGAIQFHLNGFRGRMTDGPEVRGKKTVAKEQLFRHILGRINDVHTDFLVGATTARSGGNADRWRQPYRHWLFIPRGSRIVEAGGTTQKDSAPPPLASEEA